MTSKTLPRIAMTAVASTMLLAIGVMHAAHAQDAISPAAPIDQTGGYIQATGTAAGTTNPQALMKQGDDRLLQQLEQSDGYQPAAGSSTPATSSAPRAVKLTRAKIAQAPNKADEFLHQLEQED